MPLPIGLPKINQDLLNQLRGLFYAKDRPIVLPNNGFIGLHSLDTPSVNPPFPYRFIYVKADGCLYVLDYNGNEYKVFSENNQHDHSTNIEGGKILSPKVVNKIVIGNHSDFATAQAAIDFAEANGYYHVYFPDGTYSNITLSVAGMTVQGASFANTIFEDTSGHCIEIAANRCIVFNLRINGTNGGGNNRDGINLGTTNLSRVYSVHITGADRYGIYADGNGNSFTQINFLSTQIDNDDVIFDTNSTENVLDSSTNQDGVYTDNGVNNIYGDNS